MSLLTALSPRQAAIRGGVVAESMLDGTWRVNIDGQLRRLSASSGVAPVVGRRVVVGLVSGVETIIAVGDRRGATISEVVING